MKVYNSLSKSIDDFNPSSNLVTWYTCGPTVYDMSHIGHARTFITFDVIRRILEHYGYTVFYAMNITDIDDKIIKKVSQLPNLTPENYSSKYMEFVREMENSFWKDMDDLNVLRPIVVTHVTDYISKIVKYIEVLENEGYAYHSNGSVYFDINYYISKGHNIEPLKHILDHDTDGNPNSANTFKNEKKDPRDFALWKKIKPNELGFDTDRWGNGRPGWHIECSVMATDIFGDSMDIHSGGIDLMYPHHQCEIQQATAYLHCKGNVTKESAINPTNESDTSTKKSDTSTKKSDTSTKKSDTSTKKSDSPTKKSDTPKDSANWVKYFLHSGHLYINNEKMAKSANNFITIQDYLQNIGSSQDMRMLFLMHKWYKTLDYSMDTIDEAKRINKTIQGFVDHITFLEKGSHAMKVDLTKDREYLEKINQFKIDVDIALKNNFDTVSAINSILEVVRFSYKYLEEYYNKSIVTLLKNIIISITSIFGLTYSKETNQTINVCKYVDLAINFREDIRKIVVSKENTDSMVKSKIFKVLDEFRDVKLKQAGVEVQDRGVGSTKYVLL